MEKEMVMQRRGDPFGKKGMFSDGNWYPTVLESGSNNNCDDNNNFLFLWLDAKLV